MHLSPSMTLRRLVTSLSIVALLAIVPMACDDASKPKTATAEAPELKAATNNMMEHVKKQQEEKTAAPKK